MLWGYVFGLYVATQALAYASSYKTVAQRIGLAKEFGANAGVSALVGPAHDIQTVAGFTVWKCLAVLAVVGAVWGLLTGTRLLRGEEDSGRWELLLAGQTTRRAAAAQALVGLACGVAVLWTISAAILVVVGRSSKVDVSAPGALFLAVAIVAAAAMFLAVGTLASQLARDAPPGIRLRRCRPRRELRAPHGRRLGHRPRLAPMDLTARVGRGAPAADGTPSTRSLAGCRADRRFELSDDLPRR